MCTRGGSDQLGTNQKSYGEIRIVKKAISLRTGLGLKKMDELYLDQKLYDFMRSVQTNYLVAYQLEGQGGWINCLWTRSCSPMEEKVANDSFVRRLDIMKDKL